MDEKGKIVDATGVQTAGALDAVYPYQGPLGISIEESKPVLRLWAPTALNVALQLYDDSTVKTFKVIPDDARRGHRSMERDR